MNRNNIEILLGFILLVATIFLGFSSLTSDMLFFRLLIGLSFGYTLARAYTGFAGSVNRAYKTGSTKLMRTMVFMFFLTALMVGGLMIFKEEITYNLWVNPINLGLIIGGVMFGIGMTFATCCASGVLTDLASETPKALITLIFFGMGVFVGFPIQATSPIIKKTLFSTKSFPDEGVFFPDLFGGDRVSGFLGAILLTGILCLIVIYLAYKYEAYRKAKGTLYNVPSERLQDSVKPVDLDNFKLFSGQTYDRLFVEPWSLRTGAVILSATFVILMAVSGSGWGASTPYGFWFGKLLMVFGVSPESLEAFTGKPAKIFIQPFFEHPVNVQNIGIILGATIYLLMSSNLVKSFKASLKISGLQVLLFSIAGFLMGFGTRFANGCNVGALYTPIANFSLAGWIFFAALVGGGIIGNIIEDKIFTAAGKK